MNLYIANPNGLDLRDFISNYLISKIQNYFINNLDERRLIPIEAYINSLPDIRSNVNLRKNQSINLKTLLISAVYNIRYSALPNNDYNLDIDPNAYSPYLKLNLQYIARLVNYGATGSPSYPIFDNTFNYIASNIDMYYEDYKNGGK